jgi:hypothetical protein
MINFTLYRRLLGRSKVLAVLLFSLFALGAMLCLPLQADAQPLKGASEKASQQATGFIENKGQVIDQKNQPNTTVKYLLSLPGLNVQLKANSFSYDAHTVKINKKPLERELFPGEVEDYDVTYNFHRVDIEFIGANPAPQIIAEKQAADVLNYYTHGTPESGVLDVHHYGKIVYKDLYRGIDLEFVALPGTGKPVEYNFIVHPGADASIIKWKYTGSNGVTLEGNHLAVKTVFGELAESIPATYEMETGESVAMAYKSLGNNTFAFKTGEYNRTKTLVIDPMPELKWATYYGGAVIDYAYGMGYDAGDNMYLVGSSTSTAGIATSGAFQSTMAGLAGYGSGGDCFVVKFSPAGARLWATYFGGANNEIAHAIAIDNKSNLYIQGTTSSTTGFATTGAFQTTQTGGYNDAFLAKFTTNGARVWATFFGGTGNDRGVQNGIAVDAGANVYITGTNNSSGTGITTAGVYQTTRSSASAYDDAFVAKFDSSGSLKWGTYYGGPDHDIAYSILLDPNGNVYISGSAIATTGIATVGSHQATKGGTTDGFIAKLNSTGTALVWATYYGGTAVDVVSGLAMGPGGDIYAAGYTVSTGAIATTGTHNTTFNGGTYDGFIARFTSGGTRVWGTYYGGSAEDIIRSLRSDATGNVFVAGDATSTSGITTSSAYQTALAGGRDAFLAKFNPNGTLNWGTYYGGSAEEVGWSIEMGSQSTICLVGRTVSTSGIATSGAFQTAFAGGTHDGFIAKFQELQGYNNAGTNKFTAPSPYLCVGTQDVKVEIVNSGLNALNTLSIEWELNGVAQTPQTISTPLDPGKAREITLGAVNFTANQEKKIKVWTSMPNGVADTIRANDTVLTFRKPGLSGTYTVGGTSPDYPGIKEAAADLNAYGVCGPVTFNVGTGTYTGNVVINAVQGSSSTNTIKFIGASKTAVKLTHAGTVAADMVTLMLNGADHISFRDMTIENTGATFGAGIWITNNSDSVKLVNMDITVDIASASATVNGIIGSGNQTSIGDGSTGNYILFDSLYIKGGYYGLRLNGPNTTTNYVSGNVVRNCRFTDQYQFGLYLRSQFAPLVARNNFAPCRNTTSYGVYFDYSSNIEAFNNIITANDHGLYFTYVNRNLYNSSITARIFNNMVSSSGDYALYVDNSKFLKLWHNSFNADGAHSTARFIASDNLDLRNNHINSSSASISVFALHADNANAFSAMDYNNYNSTGNFVNLGTTNYPNIPILQASFPSLNQNSVGRDPLFTSPTDLHTSINVSGTYVGIDEDIDGDFRNTVSPVMGADEVNVPDNAGISKFLSPVPAFCAGTQDVKIQIGNYGTNVIDSVRINWEVNGIAQSTVYVNTSIAIRGFQDVSLGTISFVAGETKKIKIWTSMPNGVTDALPNNDSLSVTVKTGLKGTYTIGGSSPDYPDFTTAVFDLNLLGVCGPVTFDVRSGTYTERVVIKPVIGASDINTITFRGAGKLNTNLTFSGTSVNDWATLLLNGADYFTFRDMTISSMGSSFGIGILLTNQSDSNVFKNITVQASTTSTALNIAGVAHIPNMTNLYSSGGNPGNGNLFDSLDVSGGYFGIYLMGGGEGQIIRNCNLTDQYVSGIYCSEQSYLEVFRNKISPLRNTGFTYSLNLTSVTNFRVHANTVNSAGDYGMYLQLVNSFGKDPNYHSILYNNSVSNTAGYSFYCENSQEMSILHNSFRSVGTSNTFSAASFFAGSINIDFRNNHIRNDNPNSFALEADASTFDSLDYNNYYSFGGFVRIGTNYTNLAALKAGFTQFNQNSQSKDPQFISINNLHTSSFLNGTYAGIDKDIDGESRCPSKVSIGADDENQGFAKPLIFTNHTDFFTKYPLRFSNSISSLPSVTFKWYIDGAYETDSLSFGHKFLTEGAHTVKLQAQRCIHFDSAEFVINVKSGLPVTTIIGNAPDSVRVYNGYTDLGATSKNFFGVNIPVITSGNNIDTSTVGTYYIWYVVEDEWGNRDSVIRVVKVIDDVAPMLALTGNDTITIEVFADINEPGSSATDNYYKGVSITVDSSMVDKNVVGIYPITYTAIDSSANTSVLIRRVKVVDIQRPVITLIQADTMVIKVNYLYFEPGAKVKDNYCKTGLTWDVDTFPTTTVLGDYLLTYSAEDCQGNAALPVNRLVRVVDNEAPLLTLNGLPVVQIQRGATYIEEGVDIRDNYYDTALLRSLLQNPTTDLNTQLVGNYKVCYQVTDPSGNISNKICRTVMVLNNVGVDEALLNGSVKLYPNPAGSTCTIELPERAAANIGITITDMTGRAIHSAAIAAGETMAVVDLENFAAGVYNVNLLQGNGNKVIRLTVVK